MPYVRARRPFVGQNLNVDADPADPREASGGYNALLRDGSIEKRPGWSSIEDLSAVGEIRGVYDWRKQDGTVLQLIVAGQSIYKRTTAGVLTLISSGLAASDKPVSFESFNDKVYFCDGSEGLQATDGTNLYDAMVSPPDEANLVAALSPGELYLAPGGYSMKLTWYSTTWGIETNASDLDADAYFEIDAEPYKGTGHWYGITATITCPNVDPPDARFDRLRMYIRKEEVESEWTRYYYTIVGSSRDADGFIYPDAKSTTFFLGMEELKRDRNDLCPLSVDLSSEDFDLVHHHAGVLFGLVSSYPNRLYHSLIDQPWSLSRYVILGSDGDSDPIVALRSRGPFLTVYKRRSVWVLSGNSIRSFDTIPRVSNVGAAGRHCVVPVGDLDYFLSDQGSAWAFDGNQAREVGGPQADELRARETSRDDYIVGAYDEENRQALWSYTKGGGSANDAMLALNIENTSRVQKPSWMPQNLAGVTALAQVTSSDDKNELWVGFSSGTLAKSTGYLDGSAGVELYWVSQRLDGGSPDDQKLWRRIRVEFKKQSTPSMLEVGYLLDEEDSVYWLDSIPMDRTFAERRIAARSKDLRVVFRHKDSSAVEIEGFHVQAERMAVAL